MPEPTDPKLYEKIKKQIWRQNPINSAYRSGLLVKTYKQSFMKKYNSTDYYQTSKGKNSSERPLKRWFDEKWTNQRGEIGYQYDNDVYRPTRRINDKTPKTFSELSTKRIKETQKEKMHYGRVNRF